MTKTAIVSRAAAVALLAAACLAPSASAALVDLSLAYAPAEPTTCRAWSGSGTVSWNVTLAMNGTDTTLTTTPTYVTVDNSTIPVADGWSFLLVATNIGAGPPSYDDANSSTFAAGNAAYNPGPGALDLELYSGSHVPPAAPAKIAVILTPSAASSGGVHTFNLVATTHRAGLASQVVTTLSLCVSLPTYPAFDVGGATSSLQGAANSTVIATFWLNNTGDGVDTYACRGVLDNASFVWWFASGLKAGNLTNATSPGGNITIRIAVFFPADALAGTNVSVALNCSSETDTALMHETAPTTVTIPQIYWIECFAGADVTLAAHPGENVTFDIGLRNRGNGPDTAVLSISGGNLSWDLLLAPTSLDLGVDESGNASLRVGIPPGALVFTYDFDVNLTSIVPGKPVCVLRFHVPVLQQYAPAVSEPPAEAGLPGGEVTFAFTVKNSGNALDSMIIDIANLSGWAVFLSPPIGEKLLQAGEETEFQATVRVPLNAVPGTYSQVVRISSKYAQLDLSASIFDEANLTVIVGATCGVSLSSEFPGWTVDPAGAAPGTTRWEVPVSLTNDGNALANFTVSVEAVEVVNALVTEGPYALEGFMDIDVGLEVFVNDSLPAGTYHFTVHAAGTCVGDPAASLAVNVTVLRGAVSMEVWTGAFGAPGSTQNQSGDTLRAPENTTINFWLNVTNHGTAPVRAGAVVVQLRDTTVCPVVPAGPNSCEDRLYEVTLTADLMPGQSVVLPVPYAVPAVMRFGTPATEAASNNRTLTFHAPPTSGIATGQDVVLHLVAQSPATPAPGDGTNGGAQPGGGVSVLILAAVGAFIGALVGGWVIMRRRKSP